MTDAVQIAGVAGGTFEATFNYRIHEGHDEVTGFFTAGDGAGGHGQFHATRLRIDSPHAEIGEAR